MGAEQILKTIQEVLKSGRPAYITDGTVTRSILSVEMDKYDVKEFLTITSEGGIIQFEISVGGYLISEWGLAELSDGFYFAPNWWIKL